MLRLLSALILFFFLVSACSQRVKQHYCVAEEVERLPLSYDNTEEQKSTKKLGLRKRCDNPTDYTPNPEKLNERPMRYVRVNFHIINTSSGKHNFSKVAGVKYVTDLLNNANSDLTDNAKMKLPEGNDTPVLPTQFRLKLTPMPNRPNDKGIYFHTDDELCFYVHKGKNRNLFNRDVIKKYAVQTESVINVFIMPHHPDSVRSKSYHAGGVGVALGTNIKMAGMYESGKPFWHFRQVLNHEVGHVYGLQHAWTGNDGCDDTPRHANCWNKSKLPGCDGVTSNNVMDYNSNQKAWTPCQLGRVHRKMCQEAARARKMLIPTWCELKIDHSVFIEENTVWDGAHDLEGHLVVLSGNTLRIGCRLSMPKGARIIVEEGATLILDRARLHNACGDTWEGIEIRERGEQKGRVQVIGEVRFENMKHAIRL